MPHTALAKRVLFVCRLNRHRSATAERIFCKRQDLDVRSAGMLEWADIIFAMDPLQVEALRRMFPVHPALERVVCLDIEDVYTFLEPRLVQLLQQRVPQYL